MSANSPGELLVCRSSVQAMYAADATPSGMSLFEQRWLKSLTTMTCDGRNDGQRYAVHLLVVRSRNARLVVRHRTTEWPV